MSQATDGATTVAASLVASLRASTAPVDPEEIFPEVYLGVVKSYNDRRGFGFLACAETAMKYGRDVYMPKAEAAQAALDAAIEEGDEAALAAAALAAEAAAKAAAAKAAALAAQENGGTVPPKDAPPIEKPPPAPRLAEEDLVRFRVRLSVEGYPQAACVKKMRKFIGAVSRIPPEEDYDAAGALSSSDASSQLHLPEIPVTRRNCGQLRLAIGDEVTFCVPDPAELLPANVEASSLTDSSLKAKMVFLAKTARSNGSVLGCFTLDLPRTGGGENPVSRPNLQLHCHAFGDKLILAGLPSDLEEAELMRFFSKQGATGTIVAHARACSFASVSFPSVVEVARFLGRTAHALSDDKDTLMAQLLPLAPGTDTALLPALPAPTLAPGEEAGALLVVWSPLVLAVAYTVELRPAGVAGPWSTVEVASNNLGNGVNRFDSNCSSCKVAGLNIGAAYEARVSYFTECGTRSEASEPSQLCVAVQAPPVSGLGAAEGFGGMLGREWGMTGPDLGGYSSAQHMQGVPPVPAAWPTMDGLLSGPAVGMEAFPPALPAYLPSSGWRSATGMVVPPPAQPELRPADEFGFAVSVQWPAVLQAAAYVVELREAGSAAFERFVRTAPEAKLGALVELRVGGLRPGPPPGRVYVAQVRTVAVDGSESQPSPPGVSPPLPSTTGATPPGASGATGEVRATSTGSTLSADAAEWKPSGSYAYDATTSSSSMMAVDPFVAPPAPLQPPPAGMGDWAPPPWLGHLQQGGNSLGSLGAVEATSSGPGFPPTAPPPFTPAPEAPAPPIAAPEVRPGDNPPPGEPTAPVSQDECLILD